MVKTEQDHFDTDNYKQIEVWMDGPYTPKACEQHNKKGRDLKPPKKGNTRKAEVDLT